MRRKGVSPLIATVILVGFTIAVAAGIMIWWSGMTKDIIDKESAEQAAKMRCVSGTSIKVLSCDNNKVLIKNTGQETVTAAIIRSMSGGDPIIEEIDIDSGEEEKVKGINDLVPPIQVIPAILEEGVLVSCTNQLVETTCLIN